MMTAEEVAERLGGVSVKWVWAQSRAGKIPHVRLGQGAIEPRSDHGVYGG